MNSYICSLYRSDQWVHTLLTFESSSSSLLSLKEECSPVLASYSEQPVATCRSPYPCISGETLWDMKSVYFLSSLFLYWQSLPFSRCLLYSSNCGNCLKVRRIINASGLHASHTGHEGQYFSPQGDHILPHQTPLQSDWVPTRKVNICILLNMHVPTSIIWGEIGYLISALVWLSCLHSWDTVCKSSNDPKTTVYEVISLLELAELERLRCFYFWIFARRAVGTMRRENVSLKGEATVQMWILFFKGGSLTEFVDGWPRYTGAADGWEDWYLCAEVKGAIAYWSSYHSSECISRKVKQCLISNRIWSM